MADVWEQSGDRLRWTAFVPMSDMDKVIEEVHFGKEHGACGVLIRGFEGNRHASDPYYDPMYEEVSQLNMPVCIHAGIGNDMLHDMYSGAPDVGNFIKFKLPVISAFHAIVMGQVPQKFPELRFGFIEVSAQWGPLPRAGHCAVHRMALGDTTSKASRPARC